MITLIDGTKLPTHEEFYKLISQENSPLFNYATFKELRQHDRFKIQFEKNNWDVILSWRANMPETYYKDIYYFIEYKSSINEWHKKFHNFLKQINNRLINSDNYDCKSIKMLLTFDKRFGQFEKILLDNKIVLIILPQEILLKKEGDSSARTGVGV